jgi:hypothetical protein
VVLNLLAAPRFVFNLGIGKPPSIQICMCKPAQKEKAIIL